MKQKVSFIIDYINGGSYGLTLKKLQEKVFQWFIVVSGVLNNISKVHQNLISENVKIQDGRRQFFCTEIKKKKILSDLTIQLYDRDKSCQKFHFNQH